MGARVFTYAKIHQFKSKDSEIKKDPLCLGNILEDFAAKNMQ